MQEPRTKTTAGLIDEPYSFIEPSAWIRHFAGLIAPGGAALDIACGTGRHARLLLDLGHPVTAIDRDISGLGELAGRAGLRAIEADLEDGSPWPLKGARFAGIVVANYLYRPLVPILIEALECDGVLIYETFAKGNERFGKPANPEFLLDDGELLDLVRGRLHVRAYEALEIAEPRPAMVQRICAINNL